MGRILGSLIFDSRIYQAIIQSVFTSADTFSSIFHEAAALQPVMQKQDFLGRHPLQSL